MRIRFLDRLSINPMITHLCDIGKIEKFNKDYINDCVNVFEEIFNNLCIRIYLTKLFNCFGQSYTIIVKYN